MFAFFQLFLKQLWGKGPLGFYIQLAGFFLAFALSLLITNYYNEDVYGVYILVFSSMDMLAMFSLMGYNQLFATHIPQFGGDLQKIKGLLYRGKRATLKNAFIFMLLGLGAAVFLPISNHLFRFYLIIASLLLPLVAITMLYTQFLYSLRVSIWPQVNESVLRSLLLVALIFCLFFVHRNSRDLGWAFGVCVMFSFVFVYQLYRRHARDITHAEPVSSRLAGQSIFLLVMINLTGIVFAQTDNIMTGIFLPTSFVGVNNVYMKMASMISLIMSGMMVVHTPVISEMIGQGRYDQVRSEIRKVNRISVLLGTLVLAAILFFAHYFLDLYNNPHMSGSKQALWLYGISSWLDLFTGPAAVILMLSGRLKALLAGYLLELGLNILLNCILIPLYHLEGAAMATLISVLCVNSYFAYLCYRYFKLNTLLIGR